jgi:hypothetical protein
VNNFSLLRTPVCSYSNAAWLLPSGAGYAQQLFSTDCPSCGLEVTKEGIAVGRLVRELVRLHDATDTQLS